MSRKTTVGAFVWLSLSRDFCRWVRRGNWNLDAQSVMHDYILCRIKCKFGNTKSGYRQYNDTLSLAQVTDEMLEL